MKNKFEIEFSLKFPLLLEYSIITDSQKIPHLINYYLAFLNFAIGIFFTPSEPYCLISFPNLFFIQCFLCHIGVSILNHSIPNKFNLYFKIRNSCLHIFHFYLWLLLAMNPRYSRCWYYH